MAVKNITNPFPVQLEQIDRSTQISDRGDITRNVSNIEQSVLPGKDFSKNYKIIVKDLDSAIINHVKSIMNIKIEDNGEMVDIPVIYGNQERWVNVRKQGVIRDKNGSLMLPLIMLRRDTLEFNDSLPSYKHDVTGEHIQILRASNWSEKNQYGRFSVDKNIEPIKENIVTGVPQFVDVKYNFVAWTQYVEQMNTVIEHFSDQHNRYWGNNTDYKFLCTIPGGVNDVVEMEANSERRVRLNFSVTLKGYLLPEVISNVINKKRFNVSKNLTKRKIVFSEKTE